MVKLKWLLNLSCRLCIVRFIIITNDLSYTQEVEKQYKGKKLDISIGFEFCKGESLHIPTDFSKIEGWYVRLAGKTEVIRNQLLLFTPT